MNKWCGRRKKGTHQWFQMHQSESEFVKIESQGKMASQALPCLSCASKPFDEQCANFDPADQNPHTCVCGHPKNRHAPCTLLFPIILVFSYCCVLLNYWFCSPFSKTAFFPFFCCFLSSFFQLSCLIFVVNLLFWFCRFLFVWFLWFLLFSLPVSLFPFLSLFLFSRFWFVLADFHFSVWFWFIMKKRIQIRGSVCAVFLCLPFFESVWKWNERAKGNGIVRDEGHSVCLVVQLFSISSASVSWSCSSVSWFEFPSLCSQYIFLDFASDFQNHLRFFWLFWPISVVNLFSLSFLALLCFAFDLAAASAVPPVGGKFLFSCLVKLLLVLSRGYPALLSLFCSPIVPLALPLSLDFSSLMTSVIHGFFFFRGVVLFLNWLHSILTLSFQSLLLSSPSISFPLLLQFCLSCFSGCNWFDQHPRRNEKFSGIHPNKPNGRFIPCCGINKNLHTRILPSYCFSYRFQFHKFSRLLCPSPPSCSLFLHFVSHFRASSFCLAWFFGDWKVVFRSLFPCKTYTGISSLWYYLDVSQSSSRSFECWSILGWHTEAMRWLSIIVWQVTHFPYFRWWPPWRRVALRNLSPLCCLWTNDSRLSEEWPQCF